MEFYRPIKGEFCKYQSPNLYFTRKDGTLALSNKENCPHSGNYLKHFWTWKSTRKTEHKKLIKANPQSKPLKLHENKIDHHRTQKQYSTWDDGVVSEMWYIGGHKAVKTYSIERKSALVKTSTEEFHYFLFLTDQFPRRY